MKHSLILLLPLILLSAALSATAGQDGDYAYTVTNGMAIITSFDKAYSGTLSISPNNLGGYP